MRSIWERIETWLAANAPEIGAYLPAGAAPEAIRKLEEALAVKLPDSMIESWRLHDGAGLGAPPLLGDWNLLPLEFILKAWKTMQDLLVEGAFSGSPSKPDARIKQGWWNRKWIPIADNSSGDYICVDLDPSPTGVSGQVISFWHAQPARHWLAVDVESWLGDFADALENGKFVVEDGYLTKIG